MTRFEFYYRVFVAILAWFCAIIFFAVDWMWLGALAMGLNHMLLAVLLMQTTYYHLGVHELVKWHREKALLDVELGEDE